MGAITREKKLPKAQSHLQLANVNEFSMTTHLSDPLNNYVLYKICFNDVCQRDGTRNSKSIGDVDLNAVGQGWRKPRNLLYIFLMVMLLQLLI